MEPRGNAAFDDDKEQIWPFLKNAMGDHAGDMAHRRHMEDGVGLPEERGRCWRDGIPVEATMPAEVNGEGQSDFGACLIDRVIEGIAIGAL